jgi:hypothetical protein
MNELSEEINGYGRGFSEHEIGKMRRLLDFMSVPNDINKTRAAQSDFFRFIVEYDKRRGKEFKKVFPEMSEFFDHCKVVGTDVIFESLARQIDPI